MLDRQVVPLIELIEHLSEIVFFHDPSEKFSVFHRKEVAKQALEQGTGYGCLLLAGDPKCRIRSLRVEEFLDGYRGIALFA